MLNKEGIKTLDLKKPSVWLATWFGCGLIKHAPGTWGSIGALPVGLAIFNFSGFWAFAIAITLVTLIGYWASEQFEKDTNTHDSKMIVIDEVAGQWIALLPLFALGSMSVLGVLLALVLFRIFDVTKVWPIGIIDQKVPGALGVMGDDIVAGIFAALCLWGILQTGII